MEVSNLFVKITADVAGAIGNLKGFESKFKQVGMNVAKVGAGMTAGLTAPLVMVGSKAFGMASDFEESLNKVTVAFGDNSKEVVDWSKTTLSSFGIAQGTALEMASLFGDMGTGMGLSMDEASKMSSGMVGLAGDLASFKNVQLDIAQTALAGIFTGETESLKKMGIVMTEANLEQFALSQGIEKSMKDMTQAEKVNLRYAYVTEMSKNSVGDFARTSESSANQVRLLQESTKELVTQLGQELLPIITPIIKDIVELVKKFSAMDQGTKELIVKIGMFVAVAGPVITVIGGIIGAVGVVIGWLGGLAGILSTVFGFMLVGIGQVIPVFGAVIGFLVSPIGLAIGAVVALIAIGVMLWKNWDVVKQKAGELFKGITGWFSRLWEDMKQIGKNLVDGLWSGISGGWQWLEDQVGGLAGGLVDGVKKILKINSPSKVFSAIGGSITEGLVDGVNGGKQSAIDATVGLGKAVTGAYNAFGLQDVGAKFDVGGDLDYKASVDGDQTYNHTGIIRVEGVNSKQDIVGVVEIIMNEMRKEVRT